jgi:hypothetical protein
LILSSDFYIRAWQFHGDTEANNVASRLQPVFFSLTDRQASTDSTGTYLYFSLVLRRLGLVQST